MADVLSRFTYLATHMLASVLEVPQKHAFHLYKMLHPFDMTLRVLKDMGYIKKVSVPRSIKKGKKKKEI
jgi:hypothetical protein